MPSDPQVTVSLTTAKVKDGVTFYAATADVRYRRDGLARTARFEFEQRAFDDPRSAEAFARDAAIAHLRRLLQPPSGTH